MRVILRAQVEVFGDEYIERDASWEHAITFLAYVSLKVRVQLIGHL